MRAREVPGGVDHHHDHQPEHEADPDRPQRAVIAVVGDDRAAAREYEAECGERLGAGTAPQGERVVHRAQHIY